MDRFKAEGAGCQCDRYVDWVTTAIFACFEVVGRAKVGTDLIRSSCLLTYLHERGLKVTLNVHPADGIRAL